MRNLPDGPFSFFLDRINQGGQKLLDFDPVEGYKRVRLSELQAGEKLIEAGTPSVFVYIPLGNALKIIPLSGYHSFSVATLMPLGTTGVIRGDIRNTDVLAELNITLNIIPKEIYLHYWYVPCTPLELKNLLSDETER